MEKVMLDDNVRYERAVLHGAGTSPAVSEYSLHPATRAGRDGKQQNGLWKTPSRLLAISTPTRSTGRRRAKKAAGAAHFPETKS